MALKDDIEAILVVYMGPIAGRFLQRQAAHINKKLEEITVLDLDNLAYWCHLSSKLTLGENTANEIKEKILALKTKKASAKK